MRWPQMAAAGLVVLLPLASRLTGGGLAFTMYASSVRYRLDIVGTEASGRPHAIAPTELSRHVGASAQPFFAGADNLRRTYDVRVLRVRLDEIAKLACSVDAAASREVSVVLVEIPAVGAELRTEAHASCR